MHPDTDTNLIHESYFFKSIGCSMKDFEAAAKEFVEREKNVISKLYENSEEVSLHSYGIGEMLFMKNRRAISLKAENNHTIPFKRSAIANDTSNGANKNSISWEEARALYLEYEEEWDEYYRDKYSIKKYEDGLRTDAKLRASRPAVNHP